MKKIMMKLVLISVCLFFALNCVESATSCQGKYEATLVGECMEIDVCTGAAINGNCPQSQTCCVADVASPDDSENLYLTKEIFLKIAGNTTRNSALYSHLVESMNIAGIRTPFHVAAYVSQLIGETDFFKRIESLQPENDFSPALGNNQTGDGIAYRGRGAIQLRGKTNYLLANASGLINLKYDLVKQPEAAAFPSVAFKVAGWFWKENAYVIKSAERAYKSSLNQLADGTFLSFVQLTYSLTTNLKSLKKRAEINERVLTEIGSTTMKRGEGVTCALKDNSIGYAVPICLLDFKKPYCGCEGAFEVRSCPYGKPNGVCRNSALIKCCVEKCYTDLDLVIMMDSSGSIGIGDFKKEKTFVKTVISNLNISQNASRVSIVRFSSNVKILTYLNTDKTKEQLLSIIDDIYYDSGQTYTHKALRAANEEIFQEVNGMRSLKEGIPKVLITITDGKSFDSVQTLYQSGLLKKREINMVSVGVGGANQTELLDLSSTPNDQYYVNNFDEILTIIKEISRTACAQPAEIEEESPVVTKVEKNTYKYFKYPLKSIDEEVDSDNSTFLKEFTIELEELVGSAELYFSFDNNNPKSESDYVQSDDSSDRNENFIDDLVYRRCRRTVKRSVTRAEVLTDDTVEPSGNKKLYQVSNLNQSRILYFSVMGLMEENSVQVKVYNRTVTVSSSISYQNGNSIYNLLILTLLVCYFFNSV